MLRHETRQFWYFHTNLGHDRTSVLDIKGTRNEGLIVVVRNGGLNGVAARYDGQNIVVLEMMV